MQFVQVVTCYCCYWEDFQEHVGIQCASYCCITDAVQQPQSLSGWLPHLGSEPVYGSSSCQYSIV